MKSWLVQIPPGVDVTQAKSLGNNQFQIGKSTYVLSPAPVKLGNFVSLEDVDGKYKPTPGPTQFMELLKQVSIPKVDSSVITAKPKVPQRTNLKQRHFPTGYKEDKSQKRALEEETVSTPKKKKIDKVKTPKSEKSKTPKTPKEKKEKKDKSERSEKKKRRKSKK